MQLVTISLLNQHQKQANMYLVPTDLPESQR